MLSKMQIKSFYTFLKRKRTVDNKILLSEKKNDSREVDNLTET